MSKKCLGCGAILQNEDVNRDGYIQDLRKTRCERCFRIKNYGEYKSVVKDNSSFIEILDNINHKDLVVLVIDLLNISEDFYSFVKRLKNPILVALTKRDLLPKSINDEKLLNYLDNFNINYIDKIVISSNKNYNFDELYNKINMYKRSSNVYIVGYTNAGKSTMINKLIYNYSDLDTEITTSMLPSTTLNSIEIKLNDELTIIDTPGIIEDGNIVNYLDNKQLKLVVSKKEIKPVTLQINDKQTIVIEDILKMVVENNNLTFFMSNNLMIKHFYKEISLDLPRQYVALVKSGEDIVISGLGFIKCTRNSKIIINTFDGVKIFTRKTLI